MGGSSSNTDSGSFLTGSNPLHEDIGLFLVQVLIIILTAKLLSFPLKYLRQPTVIAEVVGGIILGPSALSRFTGFKSNIFPDASLPKLKLMADFGLVLYLYLVGMELDPSKLSTQFKQSAFISLAGIGLPFGIGVGVSKLIYDTLAQENTETSFTSFFVFTGVAMSITAFPVLARILAERKLISTGVGQATIAAAAVDDAVAWCLLVLVVALIHNPSSAIAALYVFLTVIAWGAFLWFGIRPLLSKAVRYGHENDAYASFPVYLTFIILCISAWFTQGVGVHAIFGAFLTGIITPHEHGFALHMTEKIEDLVTTLLLPLYFAYSGLKTRIDQLNDGYSWEMVLLVIVAACGGKIIGCTSAAKASGMNWRESLTVGLLMNTKGLVELIVLNLGLDAGVITPQIFTIFVVMALATTFMTVPLVSMVYPFDLYMYSQETPTKKKRMTIQGDDDHGLVVEYEPTKTDVLDAEEDDSYTGPRSILACVPNLKTSTGMMSLTRILIGGDGRLQDSNQYQKSDPIDINMTLLRLIELQSSSLSRMMLNHDGTLDTLRSDPAMILFSSFAQLLSSSSSSSPKKVHMKSLLSVSGLDAFADNINSASIDLDSDMILFPVDAKQFSHSVLPQMKSLVEGQVSRLFSLVEGRTCVAVLYDRGFGSVASQQQQQKQEGSGKPAIMGSLFDPQSNHGNGNASGTVPMALSSSVGSSTMGRLPGMAVNNASSTSNKFSVVVLLLGDDQENLSLLRLVQQKYTLNDMMDLHIVYSSVNGMGNKKMTKAPSAASSSSTTTMDASLPLAKDSNALEAMLKALHSFPNVTITDLNPGVALSSSSLNSASTLQNKTFSGDHPLTNTTPLSSTTNGIELMAHLIAPAHPSQARMHLIIVGKSVYDPPSNGGGVMVSLEDVQATVTSLASSLKGLLGQQQQQQQQQPEEVNTSAGGVSGGGGHGTAVLKQKKESKNSISLKSYLRTKCAASYLVVQPKRRMTRRDPGKHGLDTASASEMKEVASNVV